MEPPFSSLIFVVLGFVISLCALLVESQSQNGGNAFSQPLPPPSPPPSSPPPESLTPPPPESLNSPSLPKSPSLPPPHNRQKPRNARRGHPPPAHRGHNYNTGKKIGLLFVGIAAILQIGVIGFLFFKRRQLLKVKDRYETCS